MHVEGGCYCGAVRYQADGDPAFKGLCYCRECRHVAGGSANIVMGMPVAGFSYTKGSPKEFTRSDLDKPVTREFCPECGTHLTTRVPGMPLALLKVGTLDDESLFGNPDMAIFTSEKLAFQRLPDGVSAFERGPS
jgi:hypothetical protein